MKNQQHSGRKAMEQELIEGRDTASQLLEILVHKSNNPHGDLEEGIILLPFARDLVRRVLRSFTNTLLLLKTNSDVSHEEVKVLPTTITNVSSSASCPKPEDKDEASRSFTDAKNRRGCYKRKSNAVREKDSSILTEDGYAWRKYGQKKIMNTKYLRSYYRCTHKDDQNCPATKKVQRIQEDPPLYRTTYYGHHNCKSSLINLEVIKELDTSSSSSSIFLNFNNSSLPNKEAYPFLSSLFPSTKQEPMELICDYHSGHNQLTSSDYNLLLCDYETVSII